MNAVAKLNQLEQDIADRSRVIQSQVIRLCVMTEVLRLWPGLLPKMLIAQDKPNDWWHEKNLTIREWRDRIAAIKLTRRPERLQQSVLGTVV